MAFDDDPLNPTPNTEFPQATIEASPDATRIYLYMLTGVNFANTAAGLGSSGNVSGGRAALLDIFKQTGVMPSLVWNSEQFPLATMPRGWWSGGQINSLLAPTRLQLGLNQVVINKSNTKAGTSVTAGTGLLLYTVTTGKTLYITSIRILVNPTGVADIRDSITITGTPIYSAGSASQPTSAPTADSFNPVPLKFTTGVFIDVSVTSTIYWYFTGWEE